MQTARAWRKELELPALERTNGFVERGSLIGMLCGREQGFVCHDCEIDGIVVVLRAGETRGVIGEIRFREIVLRETLRHLLPAGYALARIRFGERPQMPRGAIVRVSRDRARGEITHCLRTGADQPVMIRQRDDCFRIIRPLGYRALEIRKWISQRFCHVRKYTVLAPGTKRKRSPAHGAITQ